MGEAEPRKWLEECHWVGGQEGVSECEVSLSMCVEEGSSSVHCDRLVIVKRCEEDTYSSGLSSWYGAKSIVYESQL